jgi:hypothetical protein
MTKSMQRIMMLLESAIHQVGLGDDPKGSRKLAGVKCDQISLTVDRVCELSHTLPKPGRGLSPLFIRVHPDAQCRLSGVRSLGGARFGYWNEGLTRRIRLPSRVIRF